ncbi:hypothetical protein KCP77_09325 [Salmonella enterica subsp. enterica]|nr:hypothetical protein KCP77_09325 [Salmonella enterica subsp. enterica]
MNATGPALRQSPGLAKLFGLVTPVTRGEQDLSARRLGSAEIATRPGGTEFELSTPDDYNSFWASLSRKMLLPVRPMLA